MYRSLFCLFLVFFLTNLEAQVSKNFEYLDVFELEYANDPQISPDGEYVVYQRSGFDIMEDKSKSSLWLININDSKRHHKLTNREVSESSPSWSPNGDRIAFVSSTDEGSEIYLYWINSGAIARLTQLENSPSSLEWSPDGKSIAFTMKVNTKAPVIARMPEKPENAKWAKAPRITDRLKHEADGSGYLKPGFNHIFVVPAEGGTARQITEGDFNHSGKLSWSRDGERIFFSANRSEDWEYDFRNSEVYSVNLNNGSIQQLTERSGPDESAIVSPDGKLVAYLGFEDKVQTYQVNQLNIMDLDGSNKNLVSKDLDRSISDIVWAENSKQLYFMYNDLGDTKIATIDLKGKVKDITDNVGGTTLGRPYASGSYSVSNDGKIAYTVSKTDRPADIGIIEEGDNAAKIITGLNEDLLSYRNMGKVEEIWYKSSVDQRDIQGWIVYPPNFKEGEKYPLLVENHGGPILNYGPHFSAEIQLYAAQGYVVFYPNPRGSTSYGEEFGNLLYNNYPGDDYNDVMDGVDAVIEKGFVDTNELFVTGGSAGGIMTAWIIGKNNRFKAAVVVKPVMNWISKTLTADNYYGYVNYRYPG
ncbi:MAG TPA: S9 family peptidase, partial [Christiangramia sp.]|nr:S9 family peptidase [Christiangramia sp.]